MPIQRTGTTLAARNVSMRFLGYKWHGETFSEVLMILYVHILYPQYACLMLVPVAIVARCVHLSNLAAVLHGCGGNNDNSLRFRKWGCMHIWASHSIPESSARSFRRISGSSVYLKWLPLLECSHPFLFYPLFVSTLRHDFTCSLSIFVHPSHWFAETLGPARKQSLDGWARQPSEVCSGPHPDETRVRVHVNQM